MDSKLFYFLELDLLGERVQPFLLQLITSSRIVSWIVARRANWYGSNEVAVDRGV